MLSTEPANGAFFVDPAKRAAEEAQEAQPASQPVAAEASATPIATHQSAAGPSAAMIDVPLGTLIFRAGLLGEQQLEDALREGMRTGRRLGEVLIERGLLDERDLGRLLAGQKGLPFVEVTASDAESAALEKLSEQDARHQVALPLRHEGGQLVVAVADPSNELMLENLRRTLGIAPKLVVAPYAELVEAIGEAYARPRPELSNEPETVVNKAEAQNSEAEAENPEAEVPNPEAEVPNPEAEARPQAEVERAPAVRPMPIVLRPKEPAAESPPAPAMQSDPQKPQVEGTVVIAIDTTPAPQHFAPEPALAPQPAPEGTPEAQASVVQPAPAPELVLELPPAWSSTDEEPAEEEASPAPSPEQPASEPPTQEEAAPEPPAQEEPASLTGVILRLQDGTTLEVGTFPTVAEAAAEAQEVVIEIAAADRNSTWPFFAQRYLRPDLIVSVDLIEASSDN
jgi:type IV pilus assembly protein PilB